MKIPGIILTLCTFAGLGLTLHSAAPISTIEQSSESYYCNLLDSLDLTIRSIQTLANTHATVRRLQAGFLASRLQYKRIEFLVEYFDPYQAKLVNGPPQEWAEEDNPARILPPHGFQVIEAMLFSAKTPNPVKLRDELNQLDSLIRWLRDDEIDKAYRFNTRNMAKAMQQEIYRVITLGIAGFDSPLAKYSLRESSAAFESLIFVLNFMETDTNENATISQRFAVRLLDSAVHSLSGASSFNNFDRLAFLQQYGSSLSQLVAASFPTDHQTSLHKSPLNDTLHDLFAPNAFNLEFFAPAAPAGPLAERIILGKRLFSDPRLSATGQRSCSSCHQPYQAFTDSRPKAFATDGVTTLTRNTPTLLNSALQTRQTYDSRVYFLEQQAIRVIENPAEMGGSFPSIIRQLEKNTGYRDMFHQAYPHVQAPINSFTIAFALSCYIRSLTGLNSRFDRYLRGDTSLLNQEEKKGFNLFTGKARCATCHFVPLFNGLLPPRFDETESEVIGVPRTDATSATLDADTGKIGTTRSPVDRFAFKTPTLRNIALTAPYMHNGVFKTLDAVLKFYNKAGGHGLHIAPPNQTLPDQKLRLSRSDIRAIIAFLGALTDTCQ